MDWFGHGVLAACGLIGLRAIRDFIFNDLPWDEFVEAMTGRTTLTLMLFGVLGGTLSLILIGTLYGLMLGIILLGVCWQPDLLGTRFRRLIRR